MTESRGEPAWSRLIAPAAVTLVALLVYVRALMPGVAFDDWGEMQVVPHVLGIPHPTGYPTYVLTAWLFELLPVGSVAFRANLLSAACIALALGFLTQIMQRLGVRPILAAVAALLTGVTGTIWASAEVAEVNPLHVLLISLVTDRALAWSEGHRPRDLALGGLLVGLSLGNHVLTAFVAPFLVLFVLWSGRREWRAHPLWLVLPVATLAIGLSVYAYLPIAASLHPPLPYNDPVTFDRFRFLVTGDQFRSQYGGLFTTMDIGPYLRALPDLWGLAASRGTVIVPALGLTGLAILLRWRTAFALACWGILVLGTYVWSSYLRLEHYLLVPWLLIGLGAGVTLEAAAQVAEGRVLVLSRRAAGGAVALLGAALVGVLVAVNFPVADRSGDRTAQNYIDQTFAVLPEHAAILTFWGPSTPLWYATLVEGRRPDVLVVDDTNIVYEGWGTREARIASLICERPVFILRASEQELEPTRRLYSLTMVATLFIGGLTPTATTNEPLYRVEPPASCG